MVIHRENVLVLFFCVCRRLSASSDHDCSNLSWYLQCARLILAFCSVLFGSAPIMSSRVRPGGRSSICGCDPLLPSESAERPVPRILTRIIFFFFFLMCGWSDGSQFRAAFFDACNSPATYHGMVFFLTFIWITSPATTVQSIQLRNNTSISVQVYCWSVRYPL